MSKKIQLQVPATAIVTDYCNKICGPCSESATNDRKSAGFLNLELFKQEFEGLEGKANAPLMFSGGEPYLHKDFNNEFASAFDSFEDVIICTNGSFVEIYKGLPEYKTNAAFRLAVDKAKENIGQLIYENGERIVRLAFSANHYLPISDISDELKSRILKSAGVTPEKFKGEALLGDDLYKRIENPDDPLVRIMQESWLYKRIQVLKEADRQLREKYGIDPNASEAILYFCVAGAGLTPKITEQNQNAVMHVYGIEEKHARRSPIFGYGCAANWPNVQEPPISREPELVLRPFKNKGIVVYGSKYTSRIDKANGTFGQGIGIIKAIGDLAEILKENPIFTSKDTVYDRKSR